MQPPVSTRLCSVPTLWHWINFMPHELLFVLKLKFHFPCELMCMRLPRFWFFVFWWSKMLCYFEVITKCKLSFSIIFSEICGIFELWLTQTDRRIVFKTVMDSIGHKIRINSHYKLKLEDFTKYISEAAKSNHSFPY